MAQKTLIADATATAKPRKVGECTCGGKGWVLSESGWPARCSGCHWVSERHKRLAERLKKMTVDLEKLGGPPTEEEKKAASTIHNRAYHARSVVELREAIESELFNPDEKCECTNPTCSCQDDDDV
jgi:hypothetical protein